MGSLSDFCISARAQAREWSIDFKKEDPPKKKKKL